MVTHNYSIYGFKPSSHLTPYTVFRCIQFAMLIVFCKYWLQCWSPHEIHISFEIQEPTDTDFPLDIERK